MKSAGDLQLQISQILMETADKCGVFTSWTRAWLDMCEAAGRDPIRRPQVLLDYAGIDRYCGHRLTEYEKAMEMQAFVKQEQHRRELEDV